MWSKLLQIALLGTNRIHLPDPLVKELADLGVTDHDPAQLLLKAAATINLMKKTGHQPPIFDGQLPSPIKDDLDKMCSGRAAWYLNNVIKQNRQSIILEFLELMHQQEKILPPELIPELLNQARTNPLLWTLLEPVLGERGNWLLSLHPDWQFLRYIPNQKDWETGDLHTRIRFLTALRKTDPRKGLELLKAAWSDESTNNRKKLLQALSVNLSNADMLFLEKTLQEKQKTIRTVAIELQSAWPSSPLTQRMAERLQHYLIFDKKELQVVLPSGIDSSAIRDGISANAKRFNSGTHASQLVQMLQKFPPQILEDWSGKNAKNTTTLIAKNKDYGDLILMALADAAALHNNQEWLKYILEHWFKKYEDAHWQHFSIQKILPKISTDLYNDCSIAALKKSKAPILENTPLDLLLQSDNHLWYDGLSLSFTKKLKTWMADDDLSYWGDFHIRKILKTAARQINAELYPSIQKGWPEHRPIWGGWERDMVAFLETLQLRYKMGKALRNGNPKKA